MNLRNAALLIVDMQVDFATAHGSLFVPGAPAIVPFIASEITTARAHGIRVIWTQDWHPSEAPHFAPYGGQWPIHCVAGSPGSEIVPGLSHLTQPEDIIIRKGIYGEDGYSAFTVRNEHGMESITQLHHRLEDLSISHLEICGVATDWCVRATALDALKLGYSVTLRERGVSGIDLEPGASARAFQEVRMAGGRVG